MAEDDEGFVARWSRLKRARREGGAAEPPPTPAAPAPAAPTEDGAAPPPADAAGPAAVPDLPPIDSLDKESDFTAFMQAGVPEDLKNQALRKLWRSDPVFANLDGLLEYGEDYKAAWNSSGAVKTLYQVGRGMVDKIEETAEAPDDAPAPRDDAAASDSADAADAPAQEATADPAETDPAERS